MKAFLLSQLNIIKSISKYYNAYVAFNTGHQS